MSMGKLELNLSLQASQLSDFFLRNTFFITILTTYSIFMVNAKSLEKSRNDDFPVISK